jgi:hypothetical protein
VRDADDPLRLEMEVNDETAQALKSELDRLAGDRNSLSDSDMRALCDRLALRDAPVKCTQGAAGYAAELTLRPRQHVMREHVAEHLHADERIRVWSVPLCTNTSR